MSASPERSPDWLGRSGGDNPDVVVRFQDAYSVEEYPAALLRASVILRY